MQSSESLGETSLGQAIQADSSKGPLFSARGAIYSSQKKYDLAFKDYEKNIQIEPNVYLPYYIRSLDKYTLEDMDGSCEDLLKGYDLYKLENPESKFVQFMEENISDHCDSSKASYY